MDFEQNGISGSPIVIRAQEGVLINTSNTQTADGINLEGASYIVIEGFTILTIQPTFHTCETWLGSVLRLLSSSANLSHGTKLIQTTNLCYILYGVRCRFFQPTSYSSQPL